ncbi:MAG: low molecular weight phosphatase family protein [Alphaproteobacteria bacterium]|nr:MAG: low molecular weight phosphatase family protein [Alphaproteobacteria bacterium]
MADGPPASVLFACTHNVIRSPTAAALMRLQFGPLVRVDSVGLRPGEEVSAMAAFVMEELGADIAKYAPKGFDHFASEYYEDGPFDLIVSLSPEAHHTVLDLIPALGAEAEYWPTFDPSLTEGSRDQVLMEFRGVRDALAKRIAARFARPSTG